MDLMAGVRGGGTVGCWWVVGRRAGLHSGAFSKSDFGSVTIIAMSIPFDR